MEIEYKKKYTLIKNSHLVSNEGEAIDYINEVRGMMRYKKHNRIIGIIKWKISKYRKKKILILRR